MPIVDVERDTSSPSVLQAWDLHCAALDGTTPADPVVDDVHTLFGSVAAAAPLSAPQPPLTRYVCSVRLANLCDAAQALLHEAPSTIVPIVEFLRCAENARTTGHVVPVGIRFDSADLPAVTPISALGTTLLGRFVVVAGTVVRLSQPKPVCCEMPFECLSCGNVMPVKVDRVLTFPALCVGGTKRCKSHSFTPRPDLATCREIQAVKLQEAPGADAASEQRSGGGNGIARVLDVELAEELIDGAAAGDVIQVCGVVTARQVDKKFGGLHQLCLQALGVRATRHTQRNVVVQRGARIAQQAYSEAEIAAYSAMARDPMWFDRLANSVCPGIFGHHASKAALVLALAGGTQRRHVRSSIHVAVFGDPGLGKSQLLRAACASSPRGVYVSANTSSSCGLTVSISRDSSSETSFEAGAVVHGDGGVTCIDEIDKATQEHKALLEVMEQETLSIAKAGMIFSLPIRTTIIAAGNPVGGRFQPGRSVTDNLNLSTALLSRFDFAFVLQDQPGGAERELAGHVLDMHRTQGTQNYGSGRAAAMGGAGQLPQAQFTEFIQFARTRCAPVMSDEAKHVLRDAYLALRKAFEDGAHQQDLPVTARQLQSLVRASEARARCELSEVVTATHAQFAVDLMAQCRDSRDATATRGVAPGMAMPAVTGKGRGAKLALRDQVAAQLRSSMAARGTEVVTHAEIIEACVGLGCKNPNSMLEQLNSFGIILQQAGGKYRLKRNML